MKTKFTLLFYTCTLIFSLTALAKHNLKIVGKHSSSQQINEEYHFNEGPSDGTLFIHNINGFIDIQGYDGDVVKVELEYTVSSKTKIGLEEGLNETQFKSKNHNNEIHLYVETPYSSLDLNKGKLHYQSNKNHNNYKNILNYKVMVPKNSNLSVNTVNSGYINIDNIQAEKITAKHVNGSISLSEVSGEMNISTVNGNVDLDYFDNDVSDAKFHTVNGDFVISFNQDPSLDISYQTLNGHLYTDFNPTNVSTVVEKLNYSKKKGIKYKLKTGKRIQIGNGDINFNFKTVNGNITIARKA